MSVNEKMTAIADEIRSLTGRTSLMTLDDMPMGIVHVWDTGYAAGNVSGEEFGYTNGHKAGVAEVDAILGGVIDNTAVNLVCNANINGIRANGFVNCTKLESVSFPNMTGVINGYAFSGCTALKSVNLPKASAQISGYAFNNTGITSLVLPKVTMLYVGALINMSKLKTADFSNLRIIYADAIPSSNTAFEALILRWNGICELSSSTAFDSGNIGKGTAYIYVPKSLENNYKSATNWSNYANQIRAIEDYPEITGG